MTNRSFDCPRTGLLIRFCTPPKTGFLPSNPVPTSLSRAPVRPRSAHADQRNGPCVLLATNDPDSGRSPSTTEAPPSGAVAWSVSGIWQWTFGERGCGFCAFCTAEACNSQGLRVVLGNHLRELTSQLRCGCVLPWNGCSAAL